MSNEPLDFIFDGFLHILLLWLISVVAIHELLNKGPPWSQRFDRYPSRDDGWAQGGRNVRGNWNSFRMPTNFGWRLEVWLEQGGGTLEILHASLVLTSWTRPGEIIGEICRAISPFDLSTQELLHSFTVDSETGKTLHKRENSVQQKGSILDCSSPLGRSSSPIWLWRDSSNTRSCSPASTPTS